jgi:Uri superfamily endonuclease
LSGTEIAFPKQTGTYLLILKLDRVCEIAVGQLGKYTFHPGCFLYLGSAFGPGGLRARLGRHIRGGGKTFWHIDYLRSESEIDQIWFHIAQEPNEHQIAAWLGSQPGINIPIPGFGSSDCSCKSHLFFVEKMDTLKVICGSFEADQPGDSTWFFRQHGDEKSAVSS